MSGMTFRKSTKSDIDAIMRIIEDARLSLRQRGIDQWQNDYPNRTTIENDIDHGYSYILEQDNTVVGTVAVIFGKEITYAEIFDGNWLSKKEYAVIHRIAVVSRFMGRGFASVMIGNIERMCLEKGVRSIRVDTHEKNESMQRLLDKNGFTYCGIIYLLDKSKRLAYEKLL